MFANTGYNTGDFDVSKYEQEYKMFEKKYKNESVIFTNQNYQGHMLWDVSRPHLECLNMAQALNQNSVAGECSPLAAQLEKEFISQLAQDLGYPSTSWGYISSGGTVSNLAALWVARNKAKKRNKEMHIDVDPKYVLIAEDRHYSIEKACDLLGLQAVLLEENVNIPPNQIAVVICICGSTECGRVDDIPKWRAFCDKYQIHLHVDAAYGGYFVYCKNSDLLTPEEQNCLNNLPLADSITIDPHKLGYAPYTSGVFLLRNCEDVMFINSTQNVKYLGVMTTSLYTIEGSRSGAVAASTYFGHQQLRPHYKTILENNLLGAKLLKQKILEASEFWEPYEIAGMGQICFTSKKLPMNYLMKKFCALDNFKKDKIQLITTNMEGKDYFRICNMNPGFKDYIDKWWNKLMDEYHQYANEFEVFVKNTKENILSISESEESGDELEKLIRDGKTIVAYCGFEPSGRIHIAQAVMTVLNATKLIQNGCKVIIFIADVFAKLNRKLGGDMKKIEDVGLYIIEVLKALGILNVFKDETIPKSRLEFVWSSELIESHPHYWDRVMDISMRTREPNAKACCDIMGINPDKDKLFVSHFLYPCMQIADIFELNIDIAQFGHDQRNATSLAREYAEIINSLQKEEFEKGDKNEENQSEFQLLTLPIHLEHHLVLGYRGKKKMSKSDPTSSIFADEDTNSLNNKLVRFSVSSDQIKQDPIYDYIKYIIFPWFNKFEFENKTYTDINELTSEYSKFDKEKLKETVANYFNMIIEPVRLHFERPEFKQLHQRVLSYKDETISRIPTYLVQHDQSKSHNFVSKPPQ